MTKTLKVTLFLLISLHVTGCDRSSDGARNVIVAADKEARAAPRSIMRPTVAAPIPAPPPPAPRQVTIPFSSPGASLDATQRAMLDALAARLVDTTDTLIVRGNTDSRGSDRRNRLVSLRRAKLVGRYLTDKGVVDTRIQVVALGEDRPIAPNAKADGSDDPDGRAQNRRVDIEIVPSPPIPGGAAEHPALAPGK